MLLEAGMEALISLKLYNMPKSLDSYRKSDSRPPTHISMVYDTTN